MTLSLNPLTHCTHRFAFYKYVYSLKTIYVYIYIGMLKERGFPELPGDGMPESFPSSYEACLEGSSWSPRAFVHLALVAKK